jgi:hypothetical protein
MSSFVNAFTPEEAAAAYKRYAVPESGQIFYEAGFSKLHLHPPTEVHFKLVERAPLLILGADKDQTVPASLAKAQYKKYEHSPAKTDYLEFEGRPHLQMIASDWQEVAEAIDGWLDGVLGAPAPATQQTAPVGAAPRKISGTYTLERSADADSLKLRHDEFGNDEEELDARRPDPHLLRRFRWRSPRHRGSCGTARSPSRRRPRCRTASDDSGESRRTVARCACRCIRGAERGRGAQPLPRRR